jgi:crossover junction endodeoxyribonuclease RuvC
MIYVGIDPGLKGGVSFVDNYGSMVSMPMPDFQELKFVLRAWQADFKIKHIFLEKAQAMPKQGVVSMFNYGCHFGMLQGLILTEGYPLTLVTPQEWQKEMFKGATAKKAKEKALQIVRRLFPKEQFLGSIRAKRSHDGMIDSVLIAECCRRKII